MSIPRLRTMAYLDDGVCRYQCLACYNTMDAQDDVTGEYSGKPWRFCPLCGCKWESVQPRSPREELRQEYAAAARRPRAARPLFVIIGEYHTFHGLEEDAQTAVCRAMPLSRGAHAARRALAYARKGLTLWEAQFHNLRVVTMRSEADLKRRYGGDARVTS